MIRNSSTARARALTDLYIDIRMQTLLNFSRHSNSTSKHNVMKLIFDDSEQIGLCSLTIEMRTTLAALNQLRL